MLRFLIVIGVIIIAGNTVFAQPELDLKPSKIEFEDVFNRIQNVYFINKGDSVLTIDTIYYRSDLYLVRFDEYWRYPFKINPGDTVMMDCILSGYFSVASKDTSDTMYVISNSKNGIQELKVDIDFYDDDNESSIKGYITDGNNPIPGSKVYFLYEGSYIAASTFSDINGYYSVNIPRGRYSIAAVKDSFYATFFGQKSSPFTAKVIDIRNDDSQTASIALKRIIFTGNRISGKISDSLSFSPVKKAIIVIRKGDHNPRKINSQAIDADNTYTVFANSDGTYSAEVASPDYYFVQSFSDYFVPSYYGSDGNSSIFWQQADSVLINSSVKDKNIYLPRDSSYGGGIVEGKIILDGVPPDSLSDILIFAQSSGNNFIYSYTFSKDQGEFRITNLPYGEYKLFMQKIGYDNFYSGLVQITPQSPYVTNVEIYAKIATVGPEEFLPDNIRLYPGYPNPFNPSTTIEFFIPSETTASLIVTNILGEEIKSLYKGNLQRGNYKFTFNADGLSTGTYFVILNTPGNILVNKILLLK